jgi:hypothetical protein
VKNIDSAIDDECEMNEEESRDCAIPAGDSEAELKVILTNRPAASSRGFHSFVRNQAPSVPAPLN